MENTWKMVPKSSKHTLDGNMGFSFLVVYKTANIVFADAGRRIILI